jgi:hypothetical protein
LPKQNRPLVKDGRLQAKKKRTERSYLGGDPNEALAAFEPPLDDADAAEDALDLAEPGDTATVAAVPASAAPATASAEPAAAPSTATARPTRLPTAVRAIQQQGVRKRRDVDLVALAKRDTSYALHELRRIAILATMVVVTLVILWFFLRY